MKRHARTQRTALTIILAAGVVMTIPAAADDAEMPWRAAGLDERQAAAHLLDRLTYGPRPGDIDGVIEMGLEAWFEAQLAGTLPDAALARRLSPLDALELSLEATLEQFPNPGLLLTRMRREGTLTEEMESALANGDRESIRPALRARMEALGVRPQRELLGQVFTQKLLRARYGENQLHEVLVDFWFNHFNVSITDNETRALVGLYERDAIRPHVVGDFRSLLGATARHPAMLLYLDNARSVAEDGARTAFDRDRARRRFGGGRGRAPDAERQRRRPRGLNENYARELLELHTLGVDGGYDQDDVVAVARAFTGWTVLPPRAMRDESASRNLRRVRRLPASAGFVMKGGFLFRADVHDAEPKTVLGHRLPGGRGIEDGEAVLDLLATHPATAHHLARKLAIRFVSDTPPETLVDALATRYRETRGDLGALIRTLVHSDAFWSESARRQKIKSPFELVVSALRILDAEIERPRPLLEWVARIGQPLYAYQAPTGYPDRASAWVNTGALLARMNFGLELARGGIAGTRVDLMARIGHREPESLDAALDVFVARLLPERDHASTLRRLAPSLGRGADRAEAPLGHVVGLILGSPEFQRR